MSDISNAPDVGGAGESMPDIAPATPAIDGKINIREAASTLARWRVEKNKPKDLPAPAEESAQEAQPAEEPAKELPDKGNADPENQAPGETKDADPAETLPTIEPPRSWTQEEKEDFATYPRSAQEKILRDANRREAEFRRSQNEHAEKEKGLTVKEQAVEQAQQRYEAALPALLQTLHEQQQGEFSDVKTMEDVAKLSRDDPFRYLQWDAAQKRIATVQMEVKNAHERQAQEFTTRWSEFAVKQDELFVEKAPEFANREQAAKFADKAVSALKDTGFTDAELAELWNGKKSLSLRDHRAQLLIRDAVRFRDGQKASKAVVAKPLPPVQRPGVSQPKGAAQDAQVQALSNRLDQTGSLKDAAKMLAARRAAAR